MTLPSTVILPGTFSLQSASLLLLGPTKCMTKQTVTNNKLACWSHFQLYNQRRGPEERIRKWLWGGREQSQGPAPALSATLRGSTPPEQLGCFWKYQKQFTGTLQMAARALDNHQTPPPFSPAKRGALMSPLHEGSVDDTSCSSGWHTNLTEFKHTHTYSAHTDRGIRDLRTACQYTQWQRSVNTKWQKAWICFILQHSTINGLWVENKCSKL